MKRHFVENILKPDFFIDNIMSGKGSKVKFKYLIKIIIFRSPKHQSILKRRLRNPAVLSIGRTSELIKLRNLQEDTICNWTRNCFMDRIGAA